MNVGEFVGCLFLSRDVAHRVHLSTRSFAKHMALQQFYEGIIPLADEFAEAYQGRHGLIGSIPLRSAKTSGNIIQFLESELKEIEASRYEFCDKEDTTMQNIIDTIVSLYLSTLYKLKFLA